MRIEGSLRVYTADDWLKPYMWYNTSLQKPSKAVVGMENKETYLIKTVIQQLRYLRDEWNQNIALDNVVRNSNLLRMLLVDGNLNRAWRLCGYTYPIRLLAFTLSRLLSEINREKILCIN